MYTSAAARALRDPQEFGADTVVSVKHLTASGWTASGIRAQVRAHRWQRIGTAVIRHNGDPTPSELWSAALVVQGPRAMLTAFTGLAAQGLTGWERSEIHLLVPRGARVRRPEGLRLRVHYTDNWAAVNWPSPRRLHSVAAASVLAASELPVARHGCGLLAAVVQQRLTSGPALVSAIGAATRTRHRALLLSAAQDIAGGAEALSEIDFARLCRRAGLPEPVRQGVRRDRYGRRRYVDAEWLLPGGRRVVVEVDGAVHLNWQVLAGDQLRQNEIVLTGDVVLRYPSVIVRCEPALVINQLRRALGL